MTAVTKLLTCNAFVGGCWAYLRMGALSRTSLSHTPLPNLLCPPLARPQFAFVILDAAKKCVFAARDPSGTETLFYRLADDGECQSWSTPLLCVVNMHAAKPRLHHSSCCSYDPWHEAVALAFSIAREHIKHRFSCICEQPCRKPCCR